MLSVAATYVFSMVLPYIKIVDVGFKLIVATAMVTNPNVDLFIRGHKRSTTRFSKILWCFLILREHVEGENGQCLFSCLIKDYLLLSCSKRSVPNVFKEVRATSSIIIIISSLFQWPPSPFV